MEEIWKTHPTYTNHEGSNVARVRNNKTGKFLSGSVDKRGYIMLHLRQYNDLKISLHKFIFECFNGETDSSLYDIHHKDSDNTKIGYNYISNLEKLTRDEHNKTTHCNKRHAHYYARKIMRIYNDEDGNEIEEIFDSIRTLERLGFYAPVENENFIRNQNYRNNFDFLINYRPLSSI